MLLLPLFNLIKRWWGAVIQPAFIFGGHNKSTQKEIKCYYRQWIFKWYRVTNKQKQDILPICVTEWDYQIIFDKNSFKKHNTRSKNLIL